MSNRTRVLTDSVKSVNRIMKRQNDDNHATFGIEAVTLSNLAWQVVIADKSKHGLPKLRMINDNIASSIVLEELINTKGIKNFIPESSLCLSTATEVLVNMNLLRANPSYINNKATLDKDQLYQVNEIEKLIEAYENKLNEKEFYDDVRIIKAAISILDGSSSHLDGYEYLQCYFDKKSEIEENLCKLINGNNKPEEYTKPINNKVNYNFVECYGMANEAEYVAQNIIDNGYKFEDVHIYYTSGEYQKLLEMAFKKHDMKVFFTSGQDATSLNYVQIIKGILNWYKGGCKYQDLFYVMNNPLFAFEVVDAEGKKTFRPASDMFFFGIGYGIGWSADRYKEVEEGDYTKDTNKDGEVIPSRKAFRTELLPAFGKLAEDITGVKDAVALFDVLRKFVKEHSYRTNLENRVATPMFDQVANDIRLSSFSLDSLDEILEYVENTIDSAIVGDVTENDSEIVAVTASLVSKPECPSGKYIFAMGLSSKEFDPSISESPAFGDEIREKLFGSTPIGNVTLAKNEIIRNENILETIFNQSYEDGLVTIIRSNADITRDGSDVAASAFYERLRNEKEPKKYTGYFNITNKPLHIKREEIWSGYDVWWEEKGNPIKLQFSKTSLDNFLKCPLSYHYEKDLYISNEEYTAYEPDKWLDSKTKGTLIHRIFELYANNALVGKKVREPFDENDKAFIDAVEIAKNEMLMEKAYPNLEAFKEDLDYCIRIATNYLSYMHEDLANNGWEVCECEIKLDPEKFTRAFSACGKDFEISFTGSIDRLDKKEEDCKTVYRIVDYKTGKSKKAEEMKASTKQHLIYAQYIESIYGEDCVSGFEYQYLGTPGAKKISSAKIGANELKDEIISSTVKAHIDGTESSSDQISEQTLFGEIYVNHNYQAELGIYDEEDKCGYCKYKDLCINGFIK